VSRRFSMTARLLAVAGLALAASGACKPWTVRPIDDSARGSQPMPGRVDAAAYVESIWETRVVPSARDSSVQLDPESLAGARSAGSTVFVRGTGIVLQVDTRSRVGLALVDLAPGDGRPDVALQIGPVLRGTAVRDALPFISFGDFANQIEFADVANALNAKVLGSVLGAVDAASIDRRRITFCGAMKARAAAGGPLPDVVPVILRDGDR
jgi:predicted lipoprotein